MYSALSGLSAVAAILYFDVCICDEFDWFLLLGFGEFGESMIEVYIRLSIRPNVMGNICVTRKKSCPKWTQTFNKVIFVLGPNIIMKKKWE